jgi:hypothetical protein
LGEFKESYVSRIKTTVSNILVAFFKKILPGFDEQSLTGYQQARRLIFAWLARHVLDGRPNKWLARRTRRSPASSAQTSFLSLLTNAGVDVHIDTDSLV